MSCSSIACHSTHDLDTTSTPGLNWSWRFPLAWRDRIRLVFQNRRQRRQLLELDDRMLADIGISRQQAVAEALKSLRLAVWLP